jgi:hypothetical protein
MTAELSPSFPIEASLSLRQGRRAGVARALVAAFLSTLLPGVGQLYLGRRRRGALLLAVSLLVIAVGLRVWLMGSVFLLTLLVRPSVLLALLAVDAALLVFRLFAVLDAYRLGSPGISARRGRLGRYVALAALTLLLAVTALPHLVAGYYDYITYDMLTDVFAAHARPGLPIAGGRLVG